MSWKQPLLDCLYLVKEAYSKLVEAFSAYQSQNIALDEKHAKMFAEINKLLTDAEELIARLCLEG